MMHHHASLTEYIQIQKQYQSISFLTSIACCLQTCEWSKYRHSHTGTRSHTNINVYTNTLHTHSLSHTPTHTYKRSRYIYTLYTEQVFDVVGLCLERVAGVLLQQFHLLPLNQGFLNLQNKWITDNLLQLLLSCYSTTTTISQIVAVDSVLVFEVDLQ